MTIHTCIDRFLWCFLLFFLLGCARSQIQTKEASYYASQNPIDRYTTVVALEGDSRYLEWQAAHDRMLVALEHDILAKREAHRNLVLNFQKILKKAKEETRAALQGCQPEYDTLAKSLEIGISSRMLARNYQEIRRKIMGLLSLPNPKFPLSLKNKQNS